MLQLLKDIYRVVINLRSDTFGNPIFQKVLQNQPSSLIISALSKNHPNLSDFFFIEK